MTNKEIARVLKQTADLIVLTGGNPFRARAFQSGARRIDRLDDSALLLSQQGALTQLDGIGNGLATQIDEITQRGSFDLRDELLGALPPGLLDLLRVKGLGAKRVRQLWKELGLTTLDDLEQAAASGQLTSLGGFGTKMQTSLLASVQQLRSYQQQRRNADAVKQALPLLAKLRAHASVERAEFSGALRRNMETVSSIDLIALSSDPPALGEAWVSLFPDASVQTHSLFLAFESHLEDGFPVHLAVSEAAQFGTVWWKQTGSEAHCAALQPLLPPETLFATEDDLYQVASLDFIAPELREDSDEIEAARAKQLPTLITVSDLRGNLHNHSNYSDGAHTLVQMADAARTLGHTYFGICDHSQSLKIANGLSVERVLEQQTEIAALNAQYAADGGPAFRIFHGIESDILADGSLDYPEEVLAGFDFIVASVHSRFNMTVDEATERIITAVANPYTTILGHPTGRLLLSREGYPIDHEAVISACAAHQVAIELNANPYRLDLDWRWIRSATEAGVLIAINPDAHSMEQLSYVEWGVRVARKGWLTPAQCLNAMTADAFAQWLRSRKQH